MEGLREIGVIWWAELWRTLKSARVIVLLLLYLMFTGISGLFVHGCANGIEAQAQAQVKTLEEAGADADEVRKAYEEAKERQKREFVKTFLTDDDALVDRYLEMPLVLLIVFKLTLFFLPAYAAIMGFDQVSGELWPRSIRYLAVRSRRSSVLFGKFAAQASLLALLMLFVDAAICAFGRIAYEGFGTGEMFLTLGRFWMSALVFSWAYLGLTTLCSTLSRQPPVSLVLNLIVLFGIWLLAFVGDPPRIQDVAMFRAVPGVKYASVWYYRIDLLHPDLLPFAASALAHVGFALLFLGAAWFVLARRDV